MVQHIRRDRGVNKEEKTTWCVIIEYQEMGPCGENGTIWYNSKRVKTVT